MSNSQIVPVFDQFAVELEDGVKMFDTEGEAAAALAEFENGAEHLAIAKEFTDYLGLDGKNAKSKSNVVKGFLAWLDAGKPEAAPVVETEAPEGGDEA